MLEFGFRPTALGVNDPEPNPRVPMGPICNGDRAGPAALEDNITGQRHGSALGTLSGRPRLHSQSSTGRDSLLHTPLPTTAFEVHSPLKPSSRSGRGQGGNEVLRWGSLRAGEAG